MSEHATLLARAGSSQLLERDQRNDEDDREHQDEQQEHDPASARRVTQSHVVDDRRQERRPGLRAWSKVFDMQYCFLKWVGVGRRGMPWSPVEVNGLDRRPDACADARAVDRMCQTCYGHGDIGNRWTTRYLLSFPEDIRAHQYPDGHRRTEVESFDSKPDC